MAQTDYFARGCGRGKVGTAAPYRGNSTLDVGRCRVAARQTMLGVRLSARAVIPAAGRVAPGAATGWLKLPTADVARLLRATARLVADLPRTSDQDVVWVSGASELLVHTDRLTVELTPGLVRIGIPVECDQLDEVTTVVVPLAVGTTEQIRGLFMSTFRTPDGPDVVTGTWAEPLTAFAWEALLTLAAQLAAETGRDARGRTLVPAAIAAGRGSLLVLPMAGNEG